MLRGENKLRLEKSRELLENSGISPGKNFVPPTQTVDASGTETTITKATNQEASWMTFVVAGMVVAMLSVGLWAALRWEVGVRGWMNLLIVFPVSAFAGYSVLVVVSGELPALREIRQREKSATERYNLEYQRIVSQEAIALALIKAESKLTKASLQNSDPQKTAALPTGNYVPAKSSVAVRKAQEWLGELWEDNGDFNSYWMFDSGNIRKSPWKYAWQGESWADEAKVVLTWPGTGPLIPLGITATNDNPRGYRLRYGDRESAINACTSRPPA